MVLHIQFICLTSTDLLKEIFDWLTLSQNCTIDIFYHLEGEKKCYYISNYKEIVEKTYTNFLQSELKSWLYSINLIPSNNKLLFLYCHGNGWYFRHNNKIQGFHYLIDCIKPYYYTIFYCMSCYTSTIEILYECKDNCHYFIGSETERSDILTLPTDFSNIIDNTITTFNINNVDGDCSLIDCTKLETLFTFIKLYPLSDCKLNSYIYSKIKPRRGYNNCCYDLYTFYSLCLDNRVFNMFEKLYKEIVLTYKKSDRLLNKKSSYRCKGLAWCPVPWDSEHSWTYKYMKCYENVFWLYSKPIENFRKLL